MSHLDRLSDKNFIKNINEKDAKLISEEIRQFLIENVSKTGGHLASNLGVVELTLALCKCFDFPEDKIIFDVGHQSYVYKLLTGRIGQFPTLRKLNGLSGFPKRSESEYDSFNTGHSSTSISAALGIAHARDLNNEDYNVVAFIGDGALSGGMAFEALNNAGISNSKIIIVLNDNEMSINKNVGGLSAYLSILRVNVKYLNAKNKMHTFLNKTGKVGKALTKFVKWFKNIIKFAAIQVSIFEYLGFKYIGIIDGHNFTELTEAFEKAKNINGPVIIHTYTQKGRGYKPAEENPDLYHGISPQMSATPEHSSYTDIFGEYLVNIANKNKRVTAITAAMATGCGLTEFSNKFPERFFDVGIAEQHAVTSAAGMAVAGVIPVVCIYSTFLQRAYDQIIHDVCLQNLHVVFAIDRSGIVGEDGETHQGIFDLSYLLHIPNMTILSPSCKKELIQMIDYAVNNHSDPIAVRYPKSAIPERDCEDFVAGKAEIVCNNGNDVLLISSGGRMTDICLKTKDKLADAGYGVTVINLRTIKPFDKQVINEYLNKCTLAVTIEDNILIGGCGNYIISNVDSELKNKFINIGYDDCFVQQGKTDELFKIHNMTHDIIFDTIKKELEKNG